MVLGAGFLLTVSLILSAIISGLTKYFAGDKGAQLLWNGLNLLFSLGTYSLLFTLLFKILPNAKVTWKDTWIGGVLTALLFILGKSLLGIYLGGTAITSSYGAAGSLVVILIWVYYSAQILFVGVEFTHIYTTKYGSKKHS
jgi:membrane protein